MPLYKVDYKLILDSKRGENIEHVGFLIKESFSSHTVADEITSGWLDLHNTKLIPLDDIDLTEMVNTKFEILRISEDFT